MNKKHRKELKRKKKKLNRLKYELKVGDSFKPYFWGVTKRGKRL